MLCMSDWWEYVIRTSGTNVQKTMAEDTGISETAFSRWKKEQNKAEAPHVIAFARAYQRPPVEALVAAGILSEEDAASVIEVHRGLTDVTNEELLDAVRNRLLPDDAQADRLNAVAARTAKGVRVKESKQGHDKRA